MSEQLEHDTIRARIGAAVNELYHDAEKERLWFTLPQALLGGERPERLMACGQSAEVLRVLQGLLDGVYF